jgi:hypothetical protein
MVLVRLPRHQLTAAPVSSHATRLSRQQGWQAADLHPHRERRSHRGLAHSPDTTYLQTLRRPHGSTATQPQHPLNYLAGKAS